MITISKSFMDAAEVLTAINAPSTNRILPISDLI